MKNRRLYILLVCATLLLMIACKKETPDIWMSSTSDFDGSWQVKYDHPIYAIDYTDNITYNVSSNNGDSIWLESTERTLRYKVRVPVNSAGLLFGTQDTLIDIIDSVKVVIKNGKIIKSASTMPSGLLVDSIYYEVWFAGLAPNDKLLVGGYRKTGFPEDDYR